MVTININGLTLCHRGSGGISDNTLPNVCKTPSNGIPVPFQNEAYSSDLVGGTTSVHADGGNMIANYGSQFSKSVFDEGGSLGGVVSGTHLAEADWITHSFDVFFESKAACRLTDKLFMNHRNTVNMAGLKQRDLPPSDQSFLDELCRMACECLKELAGKLEPGQQYQTCVARKIAEKYYDGSYPKPGAQMWREVPFDRGSGWDMIGSQSDPGVPTSNYIRPNSRRLDVVRVGEDGKMKELYDMKFDDQLSEPAERDYRTIAKKHTGERKNFKEFRVREECDCDDDWPGTAPVTAPVAAPAPEKQSFLDKFGQTVQSATGLKLGAGALVTLLVISEASRLFPPRNLVPVP
jgi:hypothetical protein